MNHAEFINELTEKNIISVVRRFKRGGGEFFYRKNVSLRIIYSPSSSQEIGFRKHKAFYIAVIGTERFLDDIAPEDKKYFLFNLDLLPW